MIRIKLTKDKLIAIAQVVAIIRDHLQKSIPSMPYDLTRVDANVHLYTLEELSRKLRSKIVMMEHEPGNKPITYTFTGNQALAIIKYKEIYNSSPYRMAILQEISEPMFKKLLN